MGPGDADVTAQKLDNEEQYQLLNGKTALVTGAGSGIGRAIANALGAMGATVIVAGRRQRPLDETAASVSSKGGRAIARVVDVTDDDSVAALGQFVEDSCDGQLALLVHSAGVSALGPVEQATAQQFDAVFATNIRAPFLITRRLLPLLRRAAGDIVFVNSLASLNPRAEAGVYAASKAALRAFADCLRAEINADGVRVLSVFPGRTASPMQAVIHAQEQRDYLPEQLLQPETVASAVVGAVTMPRTAELTELFVRPASKM